MSGLRLNLDLRRFKRKLKAKEQAMHETKVRAIKHGAKDSMSTSW